MLSQVVHVTKSALSTATPTLNRALGASFSSAAAAAGAPTGELKRTALYNAHVEAGAKMVPFAGWEMPVTYPAGLMKEHLFCRSSAGLFDVSHMCQLSITGEDRLAFMNNLVVSDIANTPLRQAQYSLMCLPHGGILDDTLITPLEESVYMVANAGCYDKDMAHIRAVEATWKADGKDVTVTELSGKSLLAIQGPKAGSVVAKLTDYNVNEVYFGGYAHFKVAGIAVGASRTGYTGMDGFELSVDHADAPALAAALTKSPDVEWVGLGARDSLRLESGLCLYGNDLEEDITPVEATLMWTLPKSRRVPGAFIGVDRVLEQLADPSLVKRKRVGFVTPPGPVARQGAALLDADGNQVGVVTSGTAGPSMKHPVGMAHVDKPFIKAGTELYVEMRKKKIPATITKMPFVPHTYYRKEE